MLQEDWVQYPVFFGIQDQALHVEWVDGNEE